MANIEYNFKPNVLSNKTAQNHLSDFTEGDIFFLKDKGVPIPKDRVSGADSADKGKVPVVNADGGFELGQLAQTDASVSGTKAVFSTNTGVQGTTIPATTVAGKVLKSTSTAGTVEWGDTSGGTKLYKHLIPFTGVAGVQTIVAISTQSTAYTSLFDLKSFLGNMALSPVVSAYLVNNSFISNIISTPANPNVGSVYCANSEIGVQKIDVVNFLNDVVSEL